GPAGRGTRFRPRAVYTRKRPAYPLLMSDKIWAHSGDSHLLEPDDLWHQIMPKRQADRMPRTERISDTQERVTVDGQSFTRNLPKIYTVKGTTGETISEISSRPPGARDLQ